MATKLENWRREFTTALEEEIAWQQEHGGHRYVLSEGLFLGRSGERFLYLFEMDADYALPDDTPVWVRAGGVGVAGEVLGVDGFHLTLALDDFLGARVGRAEMRAAFWQLLVALRERLAGVGVTPDYNVDMALAAVIPPLLSSYGAEKTPDAPGLCTGQDVARRMAETQPLTLVWGPPGTGKTEVLADIAAGHYRAGRTVLIVSHSNVAVDNAVARVARFLTGDPGLIAGRVVRYGSPRLPEVRQNEFVATAHLAARVRPDLIRLMVGLEERRRTLKQYLGAGSAGRPARMAGGGESLASPPNGDLRRALAEVEQRLYRVRQEIRALEDEIAAGAAVLATTLTRATVKAAVYGRPWDTVILDEASMASLPQVFFAAALARRRLVLLGDFRQLAPIAQADTPAVREWLRRDVFDQLGVIRAIEEGLAHPYLVLLAEQRRMHPAIAAFSSTAVYSGLLTSAPGMARRRAEIVDRRPFPGKALAGIDLAGSPAATGKSGHSRVNLFSALVAVHLAGVALAGGLESVAVITPYVAQSRLLRALAQELYPDRVMAADGEASLHVATVHRFQGSERDVVILDLVDGYPLRAPGRLLTDTANDGARRMINVALTRARGKFILLAHRGYLEGRLALGSIVRRLLAHVAEQGGLLPVAASLRSTAEPTHAPEEGAGDGRMTWYGDAETALARWRADCRGAREVTVDLPGMGRPSREWITALRVLARGGVPLVLRCPDPRAIPAGLSPLARSHRWSRAAATLIDGNILWLGAPWPDDPSGDAWCACRLAGVSDPGHILSLSGLFTDLRSRKRPRNVK